MSKWKAGLAAAALISLAAAFPAFATETIDFVTLDIYMGITPGESGNNMGVGVRSDGCYVDDWEITNESGEWEASDRPKVKLIVLADEEYEFAPDFSADSVEILDGAGTVTKVERDGDQTLYVYATMRRISDLNDKFSEDDDYDSDDKYSDDDEDYDDGYDEDDEDYDEDYDDGDDHYDDSDEDYDEYDDDDSWYDLEVSGAGWDDQEGGIAYWDEMDDARRYQLKLYIDDKLYESDLLSEEASYDFSEYFTEGGSYYYKVRAVRGNKRGSWCVSDVLEVSDSEAEQISRNGGWQGDEDWIDDNSGPGADPAGSAVSPTEGAWLKDAVGYWWCNPDKTYPVNSWKLIGGKWYYFNERGYCMENAWILTDNQYYYCGQDGAMLTDTVTPDGYYVDGNGVWVSRS